MKRREVCSNCGNDENVVTVRGSYEFDYLGADGSVVLDGIELVKCPRCRNVDPVVPKMNAVMRTILHAVANKPTRLSGTDLRFARQSFQISGAEMSKIMHVDPSTLSKWENDDDPIGWQSDLLTRLFILQQGGFRVQDLPAMMKHIEDRRGRLALHIDASKLDGKNPAGYEYEPAAARK
jgi:DNA-binding transcriptional regulator YiaG